MAFAVGDTVFVPNSLVNRDQEATALSQYEIVEVGAGTGVAPHLRSVRVLLPADQDPDEGWVATSRLHAQVGISLIRIGDLNSEPLLLDPLAKSLAHYLRLLVGDDYARLAYLRTRTEFQVFWSQHRAGTSHVILVAHGRKDAVKFLGGPPTGPEDWASGSEVATMLGAHGVTPKLHVLSLCCQTGYSGFSKDVSSAEAVRTCAGPIHDVHGAIASQFCQTVLAEHFLHGRTWPIAFREARKATPGTSTFRLWQDGSLKQGAAG